MNNHLPVFEVSHKHFTWSADRRCFVAEVSDIPPLFPELTRPLYKDACDVGFAILGKHQTLRFVYVGEARDTEHEVLYWEWIAANEASTPKHLRDIRVRIYND